MLQDFLSFRIDPELIGTVIGPGGRTIKGITERTNTKIDIEDGGIVTIASHDGAAAEEAQKIIEGLTRKVHEGEIFSGVVTRIIPYRSFCRNTCLVKKGWFTFLNYLKRELRELKM